MTDAVDNINAFEVPEVIVSPPAPPPVTDLEIIERDYYEASNHFKNRASQVGIPLGVPELASLVFRVGGRANVIENLSKAIEAVEKDLVAFQAARRWVESL